MSALSRRRLRARVLAAPAGLAERLFGRRDAAFFCDGAVGLGRAATIEASSLDEVRRRAAALFATIDGPAPPLFGGVPFDGPARFILPRCLYRDGRVTCFGPADLDLPAEPPAPRVDLIERAPFRDLVERARAQIAAARADKIVAARRTIVAGRFDDAALVARLPRGAFRFAFRDGGATFLGATPERLVRKRGLEVDCEAVAGTSASTTFGAKDRAEHAPVVEAIAAALTAAGARPELAPQGPRVLPGLAHLVTPIRARLPAPAHVLDLVAALHPTPAVAGTPRDAALTWIRTHEPPRGWYAGAIGWFDAAGDGDFHVALRCALVTPDRAVLHAGAGIVAASDPDAEVAEVLLKEQTMLHVLGVDLTDEAGPGAVWSEDALCSSEDGASRAGGGDRQ